MKDELGRVEDFFAKVTKNKLPALSKSKKTWLQKHANKLALLAALMSLFGAWQIWNWAHSASIYSIYPSIYRIGGPTYINSYYRSPGMDLWLWLGLLMLVAAAIFFFRSFRQLKNNGKQGWYSAFYGVLICIGYIILAILTGSKLGSVSLALTVTLTALGLYLLFQVRSHFRADKKVA